jgi:hypothetical protein
VVRLTAWHGKRHIYCHGDRAYGSGDVTVGSEPTKLRIEMKPIRKD